MPGDIHSTSKDGLQGKQLTLQDQLVDDGHQAVVHDERDGGVQEGMVGDIDGAASALIDPDPHEPGREEAAGDKDEPRTAALIQEHVLFTDHVGPVQHECEHAALDGDVPDQGRQLVEQRLLRGGLDDAEHSFSRSL